SHAAQPGRPGHPDALQRAAQHPLAQRGQVELDVGELGHTAMLPAMSTSRQRALEPAAPRPRPKGRTMRLVDQSGRPLGPRAVATRRRLLEATEALLDERRVREVSVAEIARRAGTSPATFYQYFRDVEEATLELARVAANRVHEAIQPLASDWPGARGLDAA